MTDLAKEVPSPSVLSGALVAAATVLRRAVGRRPRRRRVNLRRGRGRFVSESRSCTQHHNRRTELVFASGILCVVAIEGSLGGGVRRPAGLQISASGTVSTDTP